MRKILLITAVAALSIATVACSKKEITPAATSNTEATTETAIETSTETTIEETEEEEIEEEYASAHILKIDGDIITVRDLDTDDVVQFDLSKAEVIKEFPLSEGDTVDITFPAGTSQHPIPAMVAEVLESVIGRNTDPSAEGKIVDATMNGITLEVEGVEYPIITSNAYVVAKNGITVDKNATVTYLGSLDDEPLAVKIVMDDSYGTDEANINAFIGEVAQLGQNGKSIVLESSIGDFFTFVSNDIDFSQYSTGEVLQIQYEGSIGAKEIPAVKVTKK